MRSVIATLIRRPVGVAMLFIALIFLGAISFQRLPTDLLPDIAYPRLVIYTSYLDGAPAEVERLVTEVVERAVAGVPGVEKIESTSREGVSLVTLRFGWGTDMDFAALDVREQLDKIIGLLPLHATRPLVLRTDPTAEPIIALTIAGPPDPWILGELAESVFKRRLEQIDGVAQAAITGGLEREVRVEVDPQRLESYDLTLDDIEAALRAENASAPGVTILRGRYRYSLRILGELTTIDEIGEIVVDRQGRAQGAAEQGGGGETARTLISLRDLARIEDGFRERESITRFNGRDAIGILIFKESGANTVRVAGRVEEAVARLRAEHPGLSIEVAVNQADFVSAAITNVVDALVQGGILAFLVLFLFLRDPRYPITIALSIPISVITTLALLDLAGISLNIMSLGGLALGVGMLVDNSIVVLENIFRHREAGLPPTTAAAVGTEEVSGAITGATLTTIAVFGPIIYIEGIAGQLFGAVSLAVSFSLLASLLVAIVLVPTISANWSNERRGTATPTRNPLRNLWRYLGTLFERIFGPILAAFDRAFSRATTRYEAALAVALDRRGPVIITAAVLLAAALGTALTLDRAVLPSVEEGALRLRLELPRGTPLEETTRIATRIESILLADPAVAATLTTIGRRDAVTGVDLEESGLNSAIMEVRLQPDAASADLIDLIRSRLTEITPGLLSVETGTATALGRLLGATEAELSVRVRGEDLDRALEFAGGLRAELAKAPELTNVRLGAELGHPEFRIEIDRERAAAFGVEPVRIAQTIERYMLGTHATDLADFDRKIPIIVRLPDERRRSLETIDLLQIDGVPIRELVRIGEAVGPTEIRRVDQTRLIPILADRNGRDLTRAFTAAENIIRETPAPPGIRTEIGGEREELRRTLHELAFAFILAILLVYMILAGIFESLVHPFIVLLSIPLALVGALLALRITGAGLNAMSMIGMVILVGIAVNNAIVLIDFINQLRKRGTALRDAILEAARARLRPIVMTTATTLLGILPMAVGVGRGADLRTPLAIAIFGGLFTSTLLTLIVVPIAYDLVDEAGRRIRSGLSARR